MRQLVFAILFAALCCAQTPANPDFSGLWKCNLEKSDFGGRSGPPDLAVRIAQKGGEISVTQIVGGAEEVYRFKLDGSESTNDSNGMPMKSKVRIEKGVLLFDSIIGEMKMSDTLTLTADGRSIVHTRKMTGPDGETNWKLLFEKKETLPDFSGNWKVVVAKSDFGAFPPPTNMTVKIDQKDPVVKMATHMASDMGDFDFESTYNTSGVETTNSFANFTMKSKARWEGSALLVESKGEGGEFSSKDKWTLSADGKTLTAIREFSGPQGEMKQTVVHEKQ